jgi:hypothetical protein
MKFLNDGPHRNYVIDCFLENKAQSVVFFEHFGKPRLVIYFQSSKDEVESNIRKYSKSMEEKRSRLEKFYNFLSNRDELLTYLAQFPFYRSTPATESIEAMN